MLLPWRRIKAHCICVVQVAVCLSPFVEKGHSNNGKQSTIMASVSGSTHIHTQRGVEKKA